MAQIEVEPGQKIFFEIFTQKVRRNHGDEEFFFRLSKFVLDLEIWVLEGGTFSKVQKSEKMLYLE